MNEKSLVKTDAGDAMKRLLAREMKSMDASLVMGQLAIGAKVKALWNISRHELFLAGGHKSMKAFCESCQYDYRWVQRLIQQGDRLAEQLFDKRISDEQRWLTMDHVKDFVEAKMKLRLLEKSEPLRLTDGSGQFSIIGDEVDDIGKTLAQGKNGKAKADGRLRGKPSSAVEMTGAAKFFVKKWKRGRITVHQVLLSVFEGGDEMLAEYDSLEWNDQQGILATAFARIDAMPRL
jgi:hypothetical protein